MLEALEELRALFAKAYPDPERNWPEPGVSLDQYHFEVFNDGSGGIEHHHDGHVMTVFMFHNLPALVEHLQAKADENAQLKLGL